MALTRAINKTAAVWIIVFSSLAAAYLLVTIGGFLLAPRHHCRISLIVYGRKHQYFSVP
jgi:hypothetical protein